MTIRLTTAFLFAAAACAQQYVVSTVAGGALPSPSPAANLPINPGSIVLDTSRNVFFTSNNVVWKLDQQGILTAVAGNSRAGFSGDGGPAVSAELNDPTGVAVDNAGNLYIVDTNNYRIRRVSSDGIIATIAGNGKRGCSGDGGPAATAQFYYPDGVAVDAAGDLFIADGICHGVREVSPSAIIRTIAGNGIQGSAGDGGPAIGAELDEPYGMAIDSAGDLFIADHYASRIREVLADGTIITVAGTGVAGHSGDGGPAISAELSEPTTVSLDGSGNIFIADSGAYVRKISDGIISNVTDVCYIGPAIPVTCPQIGVSNLAVDDSDNVYIASGYLVRKLSTDGTLTSIAGSGLCCAWGDRGPAIAAQLDQPSGLAVDGAGNLFIADLSDSLIRKLAPDETIATVAGAEAPSSTSIYPPLGVVVDSTGAIFISQANCVEKVQPNGVATMVAGTCRTLGFSGDGGPAMDALLNSPAGLALDGSGNLLIVDYGNGRIRKVSANGVITTVAGGGLSGPAGDGGLATNALLNLVGGIAVDHSGNLFIADSYNGRVRKVSPDGIITTVAGGGGSYYARGDGGLATNAFIWYPASVAVDNSGNLFIVDSVSQNVRKVSADGIITTIAGNGISGFSGDGGPATSAAFDFTNRNGYPGIAVDGDGNVFISDVANGAVRRLQPTNQPVLISAVLDAASESAAPVTPGKIVVIYGAGLGPAAPAQNEPANGTFGTQVGGVTVTFNGVAAPMIYASSGQAAAIAPYEIAGAATAEVVVTSPSGVSPPFQVQVAASAPSFFSQNGTGAGQIAAVNLDGSLNDATHPVGIGGYVSLYATGEGQTSEAGEDGKLATLPYPQPTLPVNLTVGGIPVTPVYAGAAPGEVAGLMQIVFQVPAGIEPSGYVPVVLQVGSASTVNGAAWLAVTGN